MSSKLWLLVPLVFLVLLFFSYQNTRQPYSPPVEPAFPLTNPQASYTLIKEGEYYWIKYQPEPANPDLFTKVLLGTAPQDVTPVLNTPLILTGTFRFGIPQCPAADCARPQGNSLLLDIASLTRVVPPQRDDTRAPTP